MNQPASIFMVGMNVPADADAAAIAEFNTFYDTIHVPEFLAFNPGFVAARRYELLNPDPRAPRFLAIYDAESVAAADAFHTRRINPVPGASRYTPGPSAYEHHATVWNPLFRFLAASAAPDDTSNVGGLFIVAMNVPTDTDATGMAAFDEFYTRTHVPEVVARYAGFTRGTRYEILHSDPRLPRFLAIYDITSEADARRHAAGMATPPPPGTFSSGPPAWQRHETVWRLTYRRIG